MKKLFSILLAFAIALTTMWAMPGFESYLPDKSGEYVYYKDNTFHRESYLGILYYDESTVQVRYFAPASIDKNLPENEISILISINPESPHWEMTGERILSTITPNTDDVEIVNYLHDILYEFSAHRNKVSDVNKRNIELYQDFSQFGGNVAITYDCTIPLFNIREIKKANGTVLLKCCTTGQLLNDADTSFDNFSGFPKDNYKKGKGSYKSTKPMKCTLDSQSITLDKNWQPLMSNIWALNNDALLSMGTIPPLMETEDNNQIENFLIRYFAKSKKNAYLIFDTLKIDTNDNKVKITAETYDSINKNTTVNNIIISRNNNSDTMDIMSMTIYKQPWLNNKNYFQKIIKSYNN